jgi:hypothetical protein
MVLASLADEAATAFGLGIAGQLSGRKAKEFAILNEAIRLRLTGDRRAEHVLAAVERDPSDKQLRDALAGELSYYAEVDPDFGDKLGSVIRQM